MWYHFAVIGFFSGLIMCIVGAIGIWCYNTNAIDYERESLNDDQWLGSEYSLRCGYCNNFLATNVTHPNHYDAVFDLTNHIRMYHHQQCVTSNNVSATLERIGDENATSS